MLTVLERVLCATSNNRMKATDAGKTTVMMDSMTTGVSTMIDRAQTATVPSRTTLARCLRGFVLTAVMSALAACSSGDGGTDVTIGSGQSAGGGANGSTGGDPVAVDYPVFYVKRPVPKTDDTTNMPADDVRELLRFDIGADLYTRPSASPSSPETNITGRETRGLGDIRDVHINFDGTKVVFAMRARFIDKADEEDQPTWNIWEYDATTKVLRRLIQSDTIEEEGHDIMPHYLPDGRIVFSSTRQRAARAILLDENKPQYAAQVEGDDQPAFNLHVMDADGTNIKQISFNQAHDLDPDVTAAGRIVYTRWEKAIDNNQMDLYSMNPDGSDLQLLYGANSHNTGTVDPTTGKPAVIQFLNPHPMADNRVLSITRPFTGTGEGGDLVLIDTTNYVECNQTVPTTFVSASPLCAAQDRALPTQVKTNPGPSPGGRYRSAAPLFDGTNRLLVSWSQCRLLEDGRIVPCTSERLAKADAVEAPPLYGVYIYDVRDNTQKPIVAPQEGFIFTEVVAGSARALPAVVLDRIAGVDYPQALQTENVGILDIRSVYDFDGVDNAPGNIAGSSNPANANYQTKLQTSARYLLLEKVVSQPDRDTRDVDNSAFGPLGRAFGMRDILGYARIEPDGSVKVKVPANVAFAISTVDRLGRRLGGRHTNWLQVVPGETLECNGCHTRNANAPRAHGRKGLYTSVNAGAPTTGSPFPNTTAALPANSGETMAQARGRVMCGGACKPSVNLVPYDYWIAPAATPNDACYSKGLTDILSDPANLASRHTCVEDALKTPLPTSETCVRNWSSRCRVTINYEQHVHPLWSVDRFVDLDGDGVPDLDGTGTVINNRCDSCHNSVDGAGVAQMPAGNLNLSDGPSEADANQKLAYRDLVFGSRGQVIDDTGALVEECLRTEIDPVTNVEVCVEFRNVPAPLNVGNPRGSRFFQVFDVGSDTVDHRGFMNLAELKLISEWLNVGAQYYNDPFVAPEN